MTRSRTLAAVSLLVLAWSAQARAQSADASNAPPEPAAIDRQCVAPRDYPPGAHPGECYARVYRPAVYQTEVRPVEIAPARRIFRTVPAVYAWDERQELVSPERIDHQIVPATYRLVTETVEVRPAGLREDFVPPVYQTVVEQVVVRPEHTEWRRRFVGPDGVSPPDAAEQPTGEILCLVAVPAEVAEVPRQVMVQPGRTIEVPIPPVTQLVTRQVIDQPEHVIDTVIPAVYRTERFQRLMTPEHTEETDIPPVFANREFRRLVSPGGVAWRLVQCERHDHPPPPAAPMIQSAPPPPPAPKIDGERG